jgi:hypothetical protein
MRRGSRSPKRGSTRTSNRNWEKYESRIQNVANRSLGDRRRCADKMTYKRNAARTEAARLSIIYSVKMDAYECPVCGGWHVGKDGHAR